MKIAALPLIVIITLVSVGLGQSVPADSEPVLQGSASYSMPQSAIDADIGGTVVVGIRVDETGKPATAVLVSGPMWPCGSTPEKGLADLASTLSETMMKLKFTPAIKNGKPVAQNIGLRLELKNPKPVPKPAEIDSASGKAKPRHISGGVLNGKAKHLPKPAYPPEVRGSGESGAVTVQVLIDEEGKVVRAGAVSGAPGLQFAAREAACQSKFSPTTLEGNPVRLSGVLTYYFVP